MLGNSWLKSMHASCLALALVLVSTACLVPAQSKILKGGVQEENLRLHPASAAGRPLQGGTTDSMRISRAPSALRGSAVDASAFGAPQSPSLDALRGSAVDDNQFAKPPKNFDIGAERGSREMALAWEKWHHQLSEAIYTRWQRMARDPGKATIRITVTRNRQITAQILDGRGGPEFMDVVMAAIQSLDGNQGLTFPAKSQRQEVSFEADYIAASNVTPGYSWVKNDVEHIKQSY